ncbi:sugar phosphate isomerase/epimerase [Paenibacillus sp. IB182496]|uniref:Sugar phosphate isomerase/epimerase n=1 Tax=Paenibacillus sabuli TaxID=2772509 RepID=A0A927BQE1_9BACL|nr:sugar phosphate isomerase/epimerase family protein [Paenibacillus sabuli]MBD2844026.1 sugar phosphate isomerase/epimerase [Paenibacillus sabuli]
MKLAIVTDELTQQPEEAVRAGLAMGLRHYELRTVLGRRVPDDAAQLTPMLAELKSRYNLAYTALSPGLFKCEPDAMTLEAQLRDRLEASIAMAQELEIGTIVCFAAVDFETHRPAELRAAVLPYLRRAAERLDECGMTLAVETEFMSGCETAQDAAKLIAAVDSPAFKVNWDPANAWIAGESPLTGYLSIRRHIAGIHVKDAFTTAWRGRNPFAVLGEGRLPWADILSAYLQDYPPGSAPAPVLTLETHVEPLIACSERSITRLRELLAGHGPLPGQTTGARAEQAAPPASGAVASDDTAAGDVAAACREGAAARADGDGNDASPARSADRATGAASPARIERPDRAAADALDVSPDAARGSNARRYDQ